MPRMKNDEKEKVSCCEDNMYGFRCFCRKPNPLTSQQAEDDGYGDFLYDQQRDERDMKQ